jgi:gluconolactonase
VKNQPVVMAYDVEPDGGLSNGRVFFDSWGDGMAVDQQGNVYLTGPGGGVLIINANREHLGSIMAPPRTSNATFGEDGSTLFITANTRLVRIRLNVKGVGF